jgi:moderate conductance mechanosensitive channel
MQSKISEYQVSNVIDEFELQALSVSSSLLEDAVRIVLVVFLASLAAALLSRLMRRIEQKMTSKRSDPDSVGRVATAYRNGLIFGRIVIWSVAGVTLL